MAVVIVGRYSQLKIKGNRWFSDQAARVSKHGVKPGDEVLLSVLESALNWANANPFRHLDILINTVNKQPGIADLDVSVQEHIPVRVGFTYDDTGNDIIGNNHYTGSVQFGNLWGLDHQVTYQYTTTDDSRVYQAHSLDYRIPLPWHHYLVFDAAYAVVQPSFYEGTLQRKGENEILPTRATSCPSTCGRLETRMVQRARFQADQQQPSLRRLPGPDLGQRHRPVDAEYQRRPVRPARGLGFALNADFSPGGLDARNTDAAFAAPTATPPAGPPATPTAAW